MKSDVPNGKKVLASMTWLAGAWQGKAWGGTFRAYYSTPDGGKVVGRSQLLKDDKISFHEFEVFEVLGKSLTLQPYPGGKPAASLVFNTKASSAKRAVFENPKNDYPKRIQYERADDKRLVIKLSNPGQKDGKQETFDLTRVAE